jgi:signal peptidase I
MNTGENENPAPAEVTPADAPRQAPPPPPPTGSAWGRLWREWVRPFLVVVGGLMAFRSAVLDWNVVPSGSMKPTIVEGDYILVNKLAYDLKLPFTGRPLVEWGGPRRGDIIVFQPPGESERYVKRVVGVPGDVLELRDNVLFVNGEPAGYERLDPEVARHFPRAFRSGDWFAREVVDGRAHAIMLSPGKPSPDSFGPVVVPPGSYFVMGDNRDDSKDSRYFGVVPRERVVGRVSSVAASLDPFDHLPRWGRFFRGLS